VLESTRDWVIIIAGSLSILLLIALLAFTAVVGLATRALLGSVRRLVNDEVTPLVDSMGNTVQQVRGTASFISETSVRPIIRVYGVIAGTRRFVGVVSGISSRRRKNKD